MAEISTPSRLPVDVIRTTIFRPGLKGPEKIGTSYLFETNPHTLVDVYPGQVEVYGGATQVSFFGRTSHKLRNGRLEVKAGSSKIVVDPHGQIVTVRSPDQTLPAKVAEGPDYPGVSIARPESFEPYSYGAVVNYLAQILGVTPDVFAQRTGGSSQVLTRLIKGETRLPNSPQTIYVGLGIRKGSQEHKLLQQAFQRERERIKEERAAKHGNSR